MGKRGRKIREDKRVRIKEGGKKRGPKKGGKKMGKKKVRKT